MGTLNEDTPTRLPKSGSHTYQFETTLKFQFNTFLSVQQVFLFGSCMFSL